MEAGHFSLSGKLVVVTGACGMLGKQFSLALARAGARVAMADMQAGACLADEIGKSSGADVRYFPLDVRDRDSAQRLLELLFEAWGIVPDVLINNAGADAPPSAGAAEARVFEEYPLAAWEHVLAVNLTGPFLMCQVIGGAMARAGRGSIINIGSIYGVVGPDQSLYEHLIASNGVSFTKPVAYSASKAGLVGLTKYLASYWKGRVRVNIAVLGGVRSAQDAQFVDKYCAKTPLGRMARSDEYNDLIVFLSSEGSSYMNGSVVVADGGFTSL